MSMQIAIVADDGAASAKELPDNCRSNKTGTPRDHYGAPSKITHGATPANATRLEVVIPEVVVMFERLRRECPVENMTEI
jgi:hypothetical protein